MTTERADRPSTATWGRRKPRWWLKACPRCGGDLYEEEAWGERSIRCLLCGHALTRQEEERLGIFAKEEDIWALETEPAKPPLNKAA